MTNDTPTSDQFAVLMIIRYYAAVVRIQAGASAALHFQVSFTVLGSVCVEF